MPDIAMCQDHDCPMRTQCYRYVAKPNEYWQTYADFQRPKDAERCENFIEDDD
jgi:hypothetical protein